MPTCPLVLDDFDHRLLDLLQRDAQQTLTRLGDAVGLSPSAVQRRLARYRKSGLLHQVAVLEPELLGNLTIAVVMVQLERESTRQLKAFHQRLRATAEVQQCYQLAGEWDYLVVVAASSLADYRTVAERLFKDDSNIKRYDTRLVFETIKRNLALPTRAAPRRRPQRS